MEITSFTATGTSNVPTPRAMPPSPKSVEAGMKPVEDTARPENVESCTVPASPSKDNASLALDQVTTIQPLQESSCTSSMEVETSNAQSTSMDFESLWDFGGNIGDDLLSISGEDVAAHYPCYEDSGIHAFPLDDPENELIQAHEGLSPKSQVEFLEGRWESASHQQHAQAREQVLSIGTHSTIRHKERYRERNNFESMSFDIPNTPYTHARHSPRNSYTSSHISSPASPAPPTLPSIASFHATSKCLIIIGKLQKLLLRHSSLSLDVILSTNKSALSELMHLLETSPELKEDYFSHIGSSFSPKGHSVPLVIFVVTLQHIYDLYSQACRIFRSSHPTHKQSPSDLSPQSASSSRSSSQSSLPQLDFGIFKIDAASQRRLFSEIILRELDNFLVVYTKVKRLFVNELDDISTQMGVMEDMFLGVKEGIWMLCESIRT
ncbi:hypothetical protein ACMFMF_010833 [Clarireedia jacksonii]